MVEWVIRLSNFDVLVPRQNFKKVFPEAGADFCRKLENSSSIFKNGRKRRCYPLPRGVFSKRKRVWFRTRLRSAANQSTPIKNLWKLISKKSSCLPWCCHRIDVWLGKLVSINSWLVLIECGWPKACVKIMPLFFLKSFLLVMGSLFVFFRCSKDKSTN